MEQSELSQKLIDAVNAHGSDLQNLNCVISVLVHQLSASQGKEGLETARVFALRVAEAMPKNSPVRPNPKRISEFFSDHPKD